MKPFVPISLLLAAATTVGASDEVTKNAKRSGTVPRVSPFDLQHRNLQKHCGTPGTKSVQCGARDDGTQRPKCCKPLVCGGNRMRHCVFPTGYNGGTGVANVDTPTLPIGDQLDYKISIRYNTTYTFKPHQFEKGREKDGFIWRLYYTNDIKWEPRGYDFCVMCRNKECEQGDYVVTSHCNANQEHFRWEWEEIQVITKPGLKNGIPTIATKCPAECDYTPPPPEPEEEEEDDDDKDEDKDDNDEDEEKDDNDNDNDDAEDDKAEVAAKSTDDQGEICSTEGFKAEECGAGPKDGRGKFCCKGLVCDPSGNKNCIDDRRRIQEEEAPTETVQIVEEPTTTEEEPVEEEPLETFQIDDGTFQDCTWVTEDPTKRESRCYKRTVYDPNSVFDGMEEMQVERNVPDPALYPVEPGFKVGLMKVKSKNLCLEPDEDWHYTLQKCNKKNLRQHFMGIDFEDKFQLYNVLHQRGKPRCMTMLHHPLAANDIDGEMIIDQPCHRALRTQTNVWVAEYRAYIDEDLKQTNDDKKGKCEGFCESDKDCEGDLVCYKRGERGWRTNLEMKVDPNPWAQIPGCSGYGEFGKNYCSKEKYISPYNSKTIQQILEDSR